MLTKKSLSVAAIAVGSVAASWILQLKPAAAAALSCAPNFTSLVTQVNPTDQNNPSLGCQYSDVLNNDKEADINSEAFFGKSDWIVAGKDDGAGQNSGDDFNFIGGTNGIIKLLNDSTLDQSVVTLLTSGRQGSSSPTDLLLTFKGAANNVDPSTVVAYLLNVPNSNGEYSWTSPFTNPNNGNLKDVSHVSLFYRAPVDGTPIPTPALLPGLVGMGIAAVRKRRVDIES
ncbi:PTPA-CTERM sorting domain-containing protein [cf. Phormidesmis sp. LEGE 11477]|nr:PTPA-CTERM sorting domain-containing protein [cf. Phormidesmis sp. LEGE 11477]